MLNKKYRRKLPDIPIKSVTKMSISEPGNEKFQTEISKDLSQAILYLSKKIPKTSKDIFESITNYFLIHRGRVFGIFENVLDLRKTSLGKVFGRKVILTSELA